MNFRTFIMLVPTAVSTPLQAITPNAVELELAGLIRDHEEQRRTEMIYDNILNMVARAKALDMARRNFTGHVDPDGYGPDKSVQLAGYPLPGWYAFDENPNDDNAIESNAAGQTSAAAVFNAWMASPPHKEHLMAVDPDDFFLTQTHYGVGHAEVPGSAHVRYYVFMSAPPNPVGDNRLEPYAEWLFAWFRPAQLDAQGDLSDTDQDGIVRIVEFALNSNPLARNAMPFPSFNPASGRLEWTLPLRADLGSLLVSVQHSPDLTPSSWSANGVQVAGNTRSIPATGKAGFMRLAVRKP
jgi:hypothetical protein